MALHTRRVIIIAAGLLVVAGAAVALKHLLRPTYTAPIVAEPATDAAARTRAELFAELQPVTVTNCEMARFGEANDGGYVLCANLLGDVAAGYSYGIAGYDGWGCDVSTRLRVPVHQYDCFDPKRPSCPGGNTTFHDECLAAERSVDAQQRRFDTLERQLAANGHAAAHVVVKMDVEAAEWEAFLSAPDEVLQRIDQLIVEFHGTSDARFVESIRRLKRFFHVANLHFNNFSCWPRLEPFPAWAYEVLLVNKRIGAANPSIPAPVPHPLDAQNNLRAADCQAAGH